MKFNVTILGSSSAIPTESRNVTSQLVNHNECLYLVDCGEGTQVQLKRFKVKISKIDNIFISHLHGDHYFGLIGLISTMHLLDRRKPLTIFCPEGLKEIIEIQLSLSQIEPGYSIIFNQIDPDGHSLLFENEWITIHSFPVFHRIKTVGFLFVEKPKERNIKKDFISRLDIPIDAFQKIKKGEDFISDDATVYSNKMITTDPPAVRSFAYTSDTLFSEKIIDSVKGVDLLYHEATFLHDMVDKAHQRYHSTAREAAITAKMSNAKKLVIGHFSTRYKDVQPLLDEARLIFDNTFLAEEGEVFDV